MSPWGAPGRRNRLAAQVRATTESAAGPYGYTISLGGSIVLTRDLAGAPHLAGALLLMVGAVLGFAMLEAFVRRASARQDDLPRSLSVWRNVHVLSAGGAIVAVWGIGHVVHGTACWGLAGLLATVVYFASYSAQQVVLHR